ncbi:COMM domain-containing protein 3 [Prorops nasuta]|uniref:COMM domain-containing protein 3 n=1 Tax=Prorops nasuta TaxID=863751 RepID=UPI0034CF5DB1
MSTILSAVMEVSTNTLKGLANILNTNILSEETFSQILDAVISHTCKEMNTKSIASLYGTKPDVVKGAFADISCLLVEAARHDLDEGGLITFLNSECINGSRVQKLCQVYKTNKNTLQEQLELTGNSLPHIVDINWRLDYCVKSDMESSIGLPLYHIRLSTKRYDDIEYLTFTCSLQQLQELVYKLKDAAKHIEKVANS